MKTLDSGIDALFRSMYTSRYCLAALFFPGQLLVMSARYEVPIYLEEKLADKQYREVYIDLNSASIPESRVFITDSSANGLQALRTGDNLFDSYVGAGRQVRWQSATRKMPHRNRNAVN